MTSPAYPLTFAHANGFPGACYQELFEALTPWEVIVPSCMGDRVRADEIRWDRFADELLESIVPLGRPVIGIGHSLGGVVTVLAAAKRPECFRAVITLDPPLLAAWKRQVHAGLKRFKLADRFTPAGKSRSRRDRFASREEAFAHFRQRGLFRNFSEKTLWLYIEHGLRDDGNGLTLTIPREVEAEIFGGLPARLPKNISELSGALFYATQPALLTANDLKWWDRMLPRFEQYPLEAGHLFPLEAPELTAQQLLTVLRQYE
jgi:pimeloyl-ACP methyl ester carboxylesterase